MKVRKPGKAASTLYGPTGRFGSVKLPRSSLIACRATLVLVCVAVISTPGKTAPDGSFTVPLICAVPCACGEPAAHTKLETSNRPIAAAKTRFMSSSSPSKKDKCSNDPEYCAEYKHFVWMMSKQYQGIGHELNELNELNSLNSFNSWLTSAGFQY